jgi:hypothetical protein
MFRKRTRRGERTLLKPQYVLAGCFGLILLVYVVGFLMVVQNPPPAATTTTTTTGGGGAVSSSAGAGSGVVVVGSNQSQQNPPSVAIGDNQRNAAAVAVEPTGVTIGWAVSITGCGADSITEGAAVLKHSIHLTTVHGPMGGRYDYKMYAIYHPEGEKCARTLETLGYTLVKRETPVAVADIKGDFLRERIQKNGCCGEKEFIKLEAYTLTDHPIIVHMDLDTLILKPMDSLFDWMLVEGGELKSTYDTSDIPLMWPDQEKPKKINAFVTRDCKRKFVFASTCPAVDYCMLIICIVMGFVPGYNYPLRGKSVTYLTLFFVLQSCILILLT